MYVHAWIHKGTSPHMHMHAYMIHENNCQMDDKVAGNPYLHATMYKEIQSLIQTWELIPLLPKMKLIPLDPWWDYQSSVLSQFRVDCRSLQQDFHWEEVSISARSSRVEGHDCLAVVFSLPFSLYFEGGFSSHYVFPLSSFHALYMGT